MDVKSGIVIVIVLALIIVVGITVYNRYNESFRADFPLRESKGTNKIWNNARVVMLRNKYTGMALTQIPRMNTVRLQGFDKLNPHQYWIYSSEGYLMNPQTQMCLSFSNPSAWGNDGLNASPSINICSQYGGEMFIYDPKTKKIINVIGMPYTAIGQKLRLSKQKRRCLSYFPRVSGPNRVIPSSGLNPKNLKNPKDLTQSIGLGNQSVAVIECDSDYNNEYMQWDIIPMTIENFENAQSNSKNFGSISYSKITPSNNDRDYYPTDKPLQFNTEKWKSNKMVRPYFNAQKTYSNLPGTYKYS